MKVCLVASNIDKIGGGPSRSVPILAKGLASCGVDTTLLTVKTDNMNTHLLDNTDVKLITVAPDVKTKELEQILLSQSFDLIHQQNLWMPIFHKVAKISRKHKIPYMMTPRGCLEPWCYKKEPNLSKRYKKFLAMALYQREDLQKSACILTTADMEHNSVRDLGFTNPVAVVPNGIEFDGYPCRSYESNKNCKKRAIFLSRVVNKKGVDILIDSWVKIKSLYPDWSLIIVGNGDDGYIAQLKTQIERNHLTDCVEILPPAFGDEKYQLYSESAFFVLPTHSENFGMVVAEALACGLPVITTQGAPWQVLEETQTGWWIKLSQENLEKALITAIETPFETLFEMGQKGAEIVRSKFYYKEVAKRIISIYEWIYEQKEKPDYVRIIK